MTIIYGAADPNYDADLYAMLVKFELEKLNVYVDQKGYATIGTGFLVSENAEAILNNMGLGLTPEQIVVAGAAIRAATTDGNGNYINFGSGATGDQAALDAINLALRNSTGNQSLNFEFTSSTQAYDTFITIKTRYENTLDGWLPPSAKPLANNLERIALFSMAYNGAIGAKVDNNGNFISWKSPSLRDALVNGDRAEAWYQIRYNTPGEQTRNYAQAALFGLYDRGTNITEEAARSVYQMYSKYSQNDELLDRDNAHTEDLARSNRWLGGLESADTLENSLKTAGDFLINKYGQGQSFSYLNIWVTSQAGGIISREGKPRGDQDNLIIGDIGADTLTGGTGNDVLVGGAGIDILTGGTGNDTYVIDSVDDVIIETSTNVKEIDSIYSSVSYDLSLTPNVENLTLTGTAALDGTGNDRANQITGNSADNILTGGLGNDILRGGAGHDTYAYTTGDGFDIIYDSDGKGSITVDGADIAAGIQYGDKRVYRTAGGQFYVKAGNDLILDNKMLVVNYDPLLGNGMGITLDDPVADVNPTTTRDIFGDLAPVDFDPNTPGVQTQLDALGNIITDPNTSSPNRSDTLYDSTGNDYISSGGGIDFIRASRGGDDIIDAGAGWDFVIESVDVGGGNDVIMGGADRDILSGGAGNDRIYANAQVSVDEAIATGNIANSGIAQYGDWLSGGTDDDTLIGSAASDVLMGGDGADLLIGGAGDDYIAGDVNWTSSDFAWYAVNNNTNYTWTIYFNPEPGYDGYNLPTTGAADVIYGGEGNDRVTGGFGNDVIFGEGGDDILWGDDGKDVLMGGAGIDVIFGGTGEDIIIGGTGDDILDGGAGQDIYIYNLGDGIDHIRENVAGSNTLRFGAGINARDITLSLGSLKLDLGNGDEIHIDNFDRNDVFNSSSINSFEFDDGTVLTSTDLLARGFDLNGTVNNDFIYGTNTTDRINGLGGDDFLAGYDGDDVLDGGAGNDNMYGGSGNDIYLFGRGSGQDTIHNLALGAAADKVDAVQFAADVLSTDVTARRTSADALTLNINGTTDTLTISDYFTYDGNSPVTRMEEIRFADTVWTVDQIKAMVFQPTSGDDELYGYSTNDVISGGDGNDNIYGLAGDDALNGDAGSDSLSGEDGNDVLYGGSGNDNLSGDNGDDILSGGAGADHLYGGADNDIYLFGRGSGQDTIYETEGNLDAVQFAADVTPYDVLVQREYDDLVLRISGTTDVLRVEFYFTSDIYPGNLVEEFRFVDGTVWTAADLMATPITYSPYTTITGTGIDDVIELNWYGADKNSAIGYGGNDQLRGGANNDLLDGGDGNDLLLGEDGHDLLLGGAGDDTLVGRAGNDVLDGGSGNDLLYGENGNDCYVFGLGSGQDTIYDYAGDLDAIQFMEGVSPQDITLRRDYSLITGLANDLILSINGTTDELRVRDYFFDWYSVPLAAPPIEEIRFNDGTVWAPDQVLSLVPAMVFQGTAGVDYINGTGWEDVLIGLTGDDYLDGYYGNDTLDGGAGNDHLYGGAGSDTYLFGLGGGHDTIYEWWGQASDRDVVQFGEGVTPSDVTVRRHWDDLHLTINGTSDELTITNYFGGAVRDIEEIRFLDGAVWTVDYVTSRAAAALATDGVDGLMGDAGSNTIHGLGGDDWITGNMWDGGDGNDLLYGDDGADEIYVDVNYSATDTASDLVDGGAGDDWIESSNSNDLIIGGTGADSIWDSGGHDVLLFNRGDGQDEFGIYTYDAVPVAQRTVSLGGGIAYADMSFSRNGNTLVLDLGNGDSMTFDWWFDTTYGNNKMVKTLQIIAASISGNTSSMFPDQRVQQFDFLGLANQFEAALVADPTITSWQLEPHLMEVSNYLGGSDTLALGGDMAYQYGMTGSTAGISEADIRAQLEDASFGIVDQTIKVAAIYGTPGDDILSGTPYADQMYGLAGNDALTGLAGNDLLDGGTGADTMVGGLGDDTYVVDNTGDIVTEHTNEGTDTVLSSISYTLGSNVENLTLTGTAVINGTGNALNNVITGNSANNVLNGGGGADSMSGGLGNDTYYVGAGDTVVENLNEGVDTVVTGLLNYTLGANVENLTVNTYNTAATALGNELDNVLTVTDGYSVYLKTVMGASDGYINSVAKGDILDGGAGADTMSGGYGDDTYYVDNANDVVIEIAGRGTDTVYASASYTLGANVENMIMTGTGLTGTGNTLNNVLTSAGGANQLAGGLGNDIYYVDNTGDVVVENLNEGTDTVNSSVSYTLSANVENLNLTGTAAINGTGNSIDNVLTGNSAANVLTGGLGNDTYYVDAGDTVVENLNEGVDTVVTGLLNYTLGANIENLTVNTYDTAATATGNELDNVLTVTDGYSAYLSSLGCSVTYINSVAQGDILDGGAGADTMSGGYGNDIYYVDNAGDVVIEIAGRGTDTVYASASYTLGANVENMVLTGTTAINGAGNTLNNTLTGNSGNNFLDGGAGNDTLSVNAGINILQGGLGNDTLTDTAGSNLLDGGAGTDTLTGNTGNELFIGGTGNDTINTGTGADIIAFNRGDGQDTLVASTGADNTISLGGGIGYANLSMSKAGNNLILDTGSGDTITLQDWFASTANRSVVNLQIVLDNMTYNPASPDALVNQQVQNFDFSALANDFDQALAADPTLTAWSMTDALLTTHLSGSDSEALGGDLAYQYNLNNSLAGIGVVPAQSVLGNANFGAAPQALQPLASLQTGAARLS